MKKRIIDNTEFKGLVTGICRDITASNWRPDYIVGLARGGLQAAVMMSHYLNVPMHTLNVSLRDNTSDIGPESNLWMAEDAFGHRIYDPMSSDDGKKKILIIDDINDSGATMNWIINDWPSGCFPNDERWDNEIWNHNVKFATIVDNLASKCNVKMDFIGMEINKAEEDVWIEFPYENWWAK